MPTSGLMLSEKMKKKLLSFVANDIAGGDVSTALVPEKNCVAQIVAREACVLAGIEEVVFLFEQGSGVKAESRKGGDGSRVNAGETVLELKGSNRAILSRERIALNVLSRMSGVATECAKACKIAGGLTKIAVTRKTLPGFNEFDKKAATLGGALPHRLNLSEMILVKDNHLKFFTNVREVVKKARKAAGGKHYEIEASTMTEAIETAKAGKESQLVILLDNLSVEKARKTIKAVKAINARIKVELSGGINFENLWLYASLEPDLISMGCLTQSVKGINFSLEIV